MYAIIHCPNVVTILGSVIYVFISRENIDIFVYIFSFIGY